ncbi:hypothetical protein [Klebsiella aerogenes]|nr:hypothetical protein [Klebsiella aerogenes]
MNNELTAALLTIEKCRELTNCPAGVDLQDWVKQLAAENVGLKNPDHWLSQSDYGYEASEIAVSNGASEHEALRAGMIAIINRIESPATDSMVARIKASAIPEGFKLVPEQMHLSDEDIQAICMQCGNGDKKGYGDYEDGILWVGELSNDGEVKYGLNIANANYPEEGSITVFEFDEPLREGADK